MVSERRGSHAAAAIDAGEPNQREVHPKAVVRASPINPQRIPINSQRFPFNPQGIPVNLQRIIAKSSNQADARSPVRSAPSMISQRNLSLEQQISVADPQRKAIQGICPSLPIIHSPVQVKDPVRAGLAPEEAALLEAELKDAIAVPHRNLFTQRNHNPEDLENPHTPCRSKRAAMTAAIGAPKLAPYTCTGERNDDFARRVARFKSLSFASSNLSDDKLVSLVSRRCSRSGGKSSERCNAPIIVFPKVVSDYRRRGVAVIQDCTGVYSSLWNPDGLQNLQNRQREGFISAQICRSTLTKSAQKVSICFIPSASPNQAVHPQGCPAKQPIIGGSSTMEGLEEQASKGQVLTDLISHMEHAESKGLDFTVMMDDIKNAPNGSFFLLHAYAHNPIGVDPTEEQWKEISHQLKVKGHFAFFDMAYQGFASGNTEKDAKAIQIFIEDGHQVGCAQSYAKNMGLYGQRVGCLSVVCDDDKQAVVVKLLCLTPS